MEIAGVFRKETIGKLGDSAVYAVWTEAREIKRNEQGRVQSRSFSGSVRHKAFLKIPVLLISPCHLF